MTRHTTTSGLPVRLTGTAIQYSGYTARHCRQRYNRFAVDRYLSWKCTVAGVHDLTAAWSSRAGLIYASAMVLLAMLILPAILGCTTPADNLLSSNPDTGAPSVEQFDGSGAAASPAFSPTMSSEFGATQGGVQDMQFARELIEQGMVPPASAFSVEGIFSEYDLGLPSQPCEHLFCVRTNMGIATNIDKIQHGWTMPRGPSVRLPGFTAAGSTDLQQSGCTAQHGYLQLALSSNIDPEHFQRPALTLIATVDTSGSMSWTQRYDNGETTSPIEVTRTLLANIADQLNADDRLAIVTFGADVHTPLPLGTADDHDAIHDVLDALVAQGSTNMEAALKQSFDIAAEATHNRTDNEPARDVRVMLFTDAQPNVGATEPTAFEQMADLAADQDIALTVFGTGVGLNADVIAAIADLRGGNAFSVYTNDDANKLMEDSWPWMVSPIAYDLSVSVTPADGWDITRAYGFAGNDAADSASFDVATVFLSKRRGALLLQLTPQPQVPITSAAASGQLHYFTPDGNKVAVDFTAAYQGPDPLDSQFWFPQPVQARDNGTQTAVALALLVESMQYAAEVYRDDPDLSLAILESAITLFQSHIADLDNDALNDELTLARNLFDLMYDGAEQGDLYGQAWPSR